MKFVGQDVELFALGLAALVGDPADFGAAVAVVNAAVEGSFDEVSSLR